MQHGVAVPQDVDPTRPLTPDGAGAVETVAARAAAAGVRLDLCVHSGKRRAEQTAHALVARLGGEVRERVGLNPSDPVEPVARWLGAGDLPDGVALVGHLPFLDRLASLLVTGDVAAQAVRFRNAGLVALVPKQGAPGFSVAWVLVPDLA